MNPHITSLHLADVRLSSLLRSMFPKQFLLLLLVLCGIGSDAALAGGNSKPITVGKQTIYTRLDQGGFDSGCVKGGFVDCPYHVNVEVWEAGRQIANWHLGVQKAANGKGGCLIASDSKAKTKAQACREWCFTGRPPKMGDVLPYMVSNAASRAIAKSADALKDLDKIGISPGSGSILWLAPGLFVAGATAASFVAAQQMLPYLLAVLAI